MWERYTIMIFAYFAKNVNIIPKQMKVIIVMGLKDFFVPLTDLCCEFQFLFTLIFDDIYIANKFLALCSAARLPSIV